MNYLAVAMVVMALTTYCIRLMPIAFFQKKIENLWIKDFLYFIPFCVLSAMTFPDVFYSTTPPGAESPHLISGFIATQVAIILSWRERGLVTVAIWSVVVAILVEGASLILF